MTLVNQTISHYKIVSQLGAGGMGEVYLAEAEYNYARQYDQAIEQLRKTIELDQNWYLGHMVLCQAYNLKGQLPEAAAQCQKARELNDDPYVLAFQAHVYAASGKRDEAMKTLGQMNELARQRYVPALDSLHSDPRFANLVRRVGL